MDNLKERTAKGLLWSTLNTGTMQVLNLVIGIFLARLLTPADYGIVGVLAIFGAIASSLQNSGLVPALINIREPKRSDYSAVFWFNMMVSATLYTILFFSAPLLASFFRQPCLVEVSRWLFLALPIQALSISAGAYLMKNMLYREMAVISIAAMALSGIVGILMAFCGFTYWSLVAQQLINPAVVTIGRLWCVPRIVSAKPDLRPVMGMLGFSLKLMVTSIVNALNFHLLTFLFGRFLPIHAVGYYAQANKWSNMAKTTISDAIGQVTQTVMVSAADEQGRELRVFRKLTRFTALLAFPALFGLALTSREFILVTIGSEWEGSVPLLQILCIGTAFAPFHTLYQNVAITHGRSDIYMWSNIGMMVAILALVIWLHGYGIAAIVWGYALVTIAWLLVWHVATCRLIGLRLRWLLADMLPFCLAALAVMALTGAATLGIASQPLLLVVRILMASILYVALMRLLKVKIFYEAVEFLLKKKKH